MDFTADSRMILRDLANATATVAGESVPVLFTAPYQATGILGEKLGNTDPQATFDADDIARLGIRHNTAVAVTIVKTSQQTAYLVKSVEPGGLGLVTCPLKLDRS